MGLTKESVIEIQEARAEQLFESAKENDPCFRCAFADKENYACMNDGLPLGDGWKCRSFRENNGGDRNAIPVASSSYLKARKGGIVW